jgi:predicted ATPase
MITYIELENFKCFDTLDLNVKPLTIITGVNGMGKSSVIQSLLLLRQSFDDRYLPQENQIELTGRLTDVINGNGLRYVLAKSYETGIKLKIDDLECSWNINTEKDSSTVDCVFTGDNKVYSSSLFDMEFQYIAAERLGPRSEYSVTNKFKNNTRLGTGQAELTASFLYKCISESMVLPIKAMKHSNVDSDLVSKNLSAWLGEIAYEGAEVSSNEITADRVEISYDFTKGKLSGKKLSPVNVGFGFSYVLPVILSVLTAKPGSLLLIENPEAHLHPAAQSKLGKFLALAANSGIQIITETHSDHLINGIRVDVRIHEKAPKIDPSNIIIYYFNSELDEDFDKRYKETIKITDTGKLDNWPVGFFDEWENNLNQLVS